MILEHPNRVNRASLIRVIDGDSFVALVRLDFMVRIEIEVRLRGVNADERYTDKGRLATAGMQELLTLNPEMLTIRTHLGPRGGRERSFQRWVADCWVGDLDLAEAMFERGLVEIDTEHRRLFGAVPWDPTVEVRGADTGGD